MTMTALICPILADQRDALIRAEMRAGKERALLEGAVVQAIRECSVSIDTASDASGLRPQEIRDLLAEAPVSGELAALAGMR